MKLSYNDIEFNSLGVLQILGQTTVPEPAEAPQRQRITVKCRLDFFEQSYADNYTLIEQVRAALATQQTTLKWQDDNGAKYLERTVTVADCDQPEEANAQGTYHQAIVFSFWYYDHDVKSNCLQATYQRTGANTPLLNLGAVENWSEKYGAQLASEMRNQRSRAGGMVAASGRFQGDTAKDLETRRKALLATKDQFFSELKSGSSGKLKFGSFEETLRITEFSAEVNQPMNCIDWSFNATFTRYPNEANYAHCDFSLSTRTDAHEGVVFLVLSGKIGAHSSAAAVQKLGRLRSTHIPTTYVQTRAESSEQKIDYESDGAGKGDGAAFIELTFSEEWRDAATVQAKYDDFDLGVVERWSERYDVARFSEMRDTRRRTGGVVDAAGKYFSGDPSVSIDERRKELLKKKDEFVAAWNKKAAALLKYGTFEQNVRVTDFRCEVDRINNWIDWSFSATFTKHPNEANYATCEFRLSQREDKSEGIIFLNFAGKISAPTAALCRSKLESLRSAHIPTGYIRLSDESDESYGRSDSVAANPGDPAGDGETFVELTFNEQWRDQTTLAATYKRSGNAPTVDLGIVEKWSERYNVERFGEMRNQRKKIMATVEASGRYFAGDLSVSLADRRVQLQAKRDTLVQQLTAAGAGTLAYGTFSETVRVTDFRCELDRLTNQLQWFISFTYTKFPNESDYSICEYRVSRRENKTDGILFISLSGKIGAPTEAKARAQLLAVRSAIIPTGYIQLTEESDVSVGETKSIVSGSNAGDGETFIELSFSEEWRDTSTLAATYQRTNGLTLDLGVIERWSERYSAQHFDEMRDARKRAGGLISASGKIFEGDPSVSLEVRRQRLFAKKDELMDELKSGASGTLAYGMFTHKVRVIDFNCDLNRLMNCIEWSMTASFTRFPNEDNYAVADFKVATRENKLDGSVSIFLSGKVASHSATAALTKLGSIRSSLIPSGYVLVSEDSDEQRFDAGTDGAGFIELTFSEEWRKHKVDVLSWTLRTTDQEDVTSGTLLTTYSGNVLARGATVDAAYATAKAKAEELGADQYSFLVRSSVTRVDRQFVTKAGSSVFVEVEFSYEYRRKGSKTYMEVRGELVLDTFGQNVENISGFIEAPNLATALGVYNTDVRNLASYTGRIVLNERRPTKAERRIKGEAVEEERFDFSFQVHQPKTQSETAMTYSIESTSNIAELDKTSTVNGVVYAISEAEANAFLDAFLAAQGLGSKRDSRRRVDYQQGNDNAATKITAFVRLEFTETFVAKLTGYAGILQCEVTLDTLYTGNRLVEKPIPSDVSIIQNTGKTVAQKTVTGNVMATTEEAAIAWAKQCRDLLLSAGRTYEQPPRLTTTFKFLPQTDGKPRGAGANVKVFNVSFQFGELVPDFALT